MAHERVTSIDVARLAGVSRSAVSRVFTPGASVSAHTAEKVRDAAEKLGYRPNVLARSLITGRSRMIGLVVAYLDNYFYPEALEKLSNALQAEGYHVLIFMASQTAGNIDTVLEEILDYQVDGIIMASVALSSELTARCQAAGVPVMLFNRAQDDAGISAVTSDNRAGGRAVARFLLDGGHKRFGHIAGWEGASTQRDREQGFADGLGEAGIDRYDREVGNFQIDEARAAARRMFDRPDRPDAVFAANDHMAFAVMDVLRYELGLSVPGDVSVVGFDDVPPASWPAYDLTTVRQRANLMVERTVATLLKMIEQPGARAEQHVLPAPLVVRGSARIPEGWDT
ncbi:MAG: LacI family DNA-binding transcriptional regulator [Roseitalea sp.]|jgi:DNA-binding LacI/PurR family transcriptional regulator|uniref:LacI family DNA-binding transcriptional regulator n=1 Tax=Oceaniradius stylonematis TaxID=2184161 RepID=A0A3A8A6F8_9HYPH|nr:LacI family DNA-binding transcriptional regulator [Oceaniradius stylonematis]MBO6552754.1 LacI family DNA-binding transcriptional regulator [Roseitalea sp.]MBO6950325.1 LacI family DNA-binding transcriptional regulator [Rhizobiaceae bacterium]MBO6591686.1 LacI family DNA-binding transcriptional regulator [Roseitalea sp.]MBO6599541.1 LacI family DNA-binding transcriptional regulator [Roseitalea sp.]MBO6611971.1 LacI family DNA-binding transcriptional regulator [Roseitalea sp.]